MEPDFWHYWVLSQLPCVAPFWPALIAGIVIASVAGVVLGLTSLRLGGHYLAMVTISFQQILMLVLTNWISLTRGPDGIPGIARPIVFGFSFADSGTYLALCIGVLWVVGFCVGRLKHGKLGRAMQAVRDNELAAGVVGVDTYRTKVIAFTLCALFGGLGGGLFAGGFTYISPDQFGFAGSVVFLTMALLGGVRSPFGAALGTALLILLPESLRFLKVTYLAVYGGAVILLMVFMPEGIWGFLETLRGFPMRVSDSSVGGDAGQFHTTRWTLVFHTLPTPKTRRFNASWSPFHSTPNLSSDWIQLWWVHVPSSPKKEDDQCETTATYGGLFPSCQCPQDGRRGCCLRGGRTRH
ncbi:MAG TPA: branched-chain amino acid ABC transporter permease [Chthoniobacterales bacterium]|nr:branched-chain amino acid ABC transporter permease [Chthoniobacterales bacterium]